MSEYFTESVQRTLPEDQHLCWRLCDRSGKQIGEFCETEEQAWSQLPINESQTPRCDAMMKFCFGDDREFIPIEKARQLESELTATRARLAELEGFITWLFDNTEMLYWPGNNAYPVENKPLAKKNARMVMEMYFTKKFPAYKEGKK